MASAESSIPTILVDRMKKDHLKRSHPEIWQIMERSKLGKLSNEKENIQFCGLVCALGEQNSTSAIFLPRKAKLSGKPDLDTAKITMQVIAKYSRSNYREDNSGQDDSGGSWLSIIKSIADDFTEHGIYSDRPHIQGRNSGKANWARTIARETPLIGNNGNIVYPNFCSSKTQDSLDSFLAQVQIAVLKVISKDHGWWLSGLAKDSKKLQGFRPPRIDRQFWAIKLKALLPSLFSNRAIRLTNYLVRYLERESYNSKSPLLFGLDDFHNVWEKMLRDVLENTEEGWNTKLPKPYFYFDNAEPPLPSGKKQMEMDIIVRQGSNLVIVDAKYYDATSVKTSPSWPDISKQLMYEIAMKDLQSNDNFTAEIYSCFIFPDFSENSDSKFVDIKMEYSNNKSQSKLPRIRCYYMSIVKVMQAYLNNEKIALPSIK
tara:strand:+ start:2735 stop:4024 length:1290 start_codon:yes stop_codon:yes gene_type:complete